MLLFPTPSAPPHLERLNQEVTLLIVNLTEAGRICFPLTKEKVKVKENVLCLMLSSGNLMR